jgi:hypothetical protein
MKTPPDSGWNPKAFSAKQVAARWPPFGGNGSKLVLFYTAANLNESSLAMTAAVQPAAPLAPLPCAH